MNCQHTSTVNIAEGKAELMILWCTQCGAYQIDERYSTGETPSTFELGEWVKPEVQR
jgi:hypothetical protein